MIEKILSALKKREEDLVEEFTGKCTADDLVCISKIREVEHCQKIVQEVAKEYGNGWIPCSERLPKEGVPVLVCNASGKVYIRQINWISRGRTEIPNWSQNSTGIIAWKPLPAPYQKGE